MLLRCEHCGTIMEPTQAACLSCLQKRDPESVRLAIEEQRRREKREVFVRVAFSALGLAFAGVLWSRWDDLVSRAPGADEKVRQAIGLADPPPQPPPPPPPSPATAPKRPSSWQVRGKVYDLMTLKPVHAKVTVSGPAGTQTVWADSDGRYQLEAPFGNDYTVNAAAVGYRRGQLLELDPPFRSKDADERRAAAESVRDADLAPLLISWDRSRRTVVQDLVLVPLTGEQALEFLDGGGKHEDAESGPSED